MKMQTKASLFLSRSRRLKGVSALFSLEKLEMVDLLNGPDSSTTSKSNRSFRSQQGEDLTDSNCLFNDNGQTICHGDLLYFSLSRFSSLFFVKHFFSFSFSHSKNKYTPTTHASTADVNLLSKQIFFCPHYALLFVFFSFSSSSSSSIESDCSYRCACRWRYTLMYIHIHTCQVSAKYRFVTVHRFVESGKCWQFEWHGFHTSKRQIRLSFECARDTLEERRERRRTGQMSIEEYHSIIRIEADRIHRVLDEHMSFIDRVNIDRKIQRRRRRKARTSASHGDRAFLWFPSFAHRTYFSQRLWPA